MNKAYSNKALPMGTVLREWRIEEVLGVGGFGIVYKAKGIYFNELVAIKEYFPSSISERDSEDTVVPIDSEAEEVHALGLKKFVEEAKLLWNLSTPTRHPNIVSVRSLFEIHGTAYMVMDFEDGISLSRMLKQGRRFNERSLWNILQPIAEGLERAHRVGVLHRDIKPPNILINEDNRPVLIDFGSARFEAAEATSTKVTFHTPPYAAIEQYVKTYPQGPWTDIYALGVVMYECITGEKPPEVLERLHAGLGKPLATGKWPGYGKKFLAAVDSAMIVKPDERPQSLSGWLAMFGKIEATDTADDEATRFYSQQVESEDIVPVPPTPNVDPKAPVATGVPKDPKAASFKRAGEETGAKKKVAEAKALSKQKEASPQPAPVEAKDAAPAAVAPAEDAKAKTPPPAVPKEPRKKPSPVMMAAAAAGLLAVVGVGALALRGGGAPVDANAAQVASAGADNSTGTLAAVGPADGAADVNAAATNAPTETMPVGTSAQPTEQTNSTQALEAEKAKTAAAQAQLAALKKAQAKANSTELASATPSLPSKKNGKTSFAEITSTPDAGVSSATAAEFNAAISDARSMAKQVMRSGSGQNVQLAKNYDSYLKTLQDSMRGIQSEKEAQKLLKQANQTRQYIVFLQKQSPSQ
ncbi:MAG TPA: serine/threonine-protein kinase [Sphingomicrobium sp.]|nr:serine/threonine-protein kinase [Sphingomicrobium sp.]